jgi:hypothetical protein
MVFSFAGAEVGTGRFKFGEATRIVGGSLGVVGKCRTTVPRRSSRLQSSMKRSGESFCSLIKTLRRFRTFFRKAVLGQPNRSSLPLQTRKNCACRSLERRSCRSALSVSTETELLYLNCTREEAEAREGEGEVPDAGRLSSSEWKRVDALSSSDIAIVAKQSRAFSGFACSRLFEGSARLIQWFEQGGRSYAIFMNAVI